MRSPLIAALVLAQLSGVACHTMRPATLESLAVDRPGEVWVTHTDQSVLLLAGPRVVNNQLIGFVDGKYRMVPVEEVQQLTRRHLAPAKTGALVAAGAVAAGTVLYLVSGTGSNYEACSSAPAAACVPMPMDPD